MNPIIKNEMQLKWIFGEDLNKWNGSLKFSEPYIIDKLGWKIGIEKKEDILNVYLLLSSSELEGRGWICNVSFNTKLYIEDNEINEFFVPGGTCLTYDFGGFETPHRNNLFGYFDLSDSKDDSRFVAIEIIMDTKMFDFNMKTSKMPSVTLKVDDVVFYLNKEMLCCVSDYFYKKFYVEKSGDSEIIIEDVDLKEFTTFLAAIHPVSLDIHEDNYHFLVKLAQRFDVSCLHHAIEKYLINDEYNLDLIDVIKIAECYRYSKLMRDCIDSFDSVDEVKRFTKSGNFHQLKDETKLAILKCFLKFPIKRI
ncbi:unnamed protein product [Caenorhabditis angaria]|uniref:BTB domain-containing protein n=1 Tax=Caenorhabditis angaria TaxID=860376 RepID=A0A9P1I209_9PELO|nr:unnamed protein product [Caenorhabditis angaria]